MSDTFFPYKEITENVKDLNVITEINTNLFILVQGK